MAEERRLTDGENEDTGAQEYTDEEGKVHHHAKKYMAEDDSEEGSNE